MNDILLPMLFPAGESTHYPKSPTFKFIPLITLLVLIPLICNIFIPASAQAEVEQPLFVEDSIVSIRGYRADILDKTGAGYVVYIDGDNSYVLTNARVVRAVDTIVVSADQTPRTDSPGQQQSDAENKQLTAELIQIESSFDYALIKVSGLNAPALQFSNRFPAAGDSVWAVTKSPGLDTMIKVEKGSVRSSYNLQTNNIGLLSHSASVGGEGVGSLLVNECSQIVGLNMSFDRQDATVRAVDGESLVRILQTQNLDVHKASAPCMPEVAEAKIEAEQAAAVALNAQRTAERLSEKLAQSDAESKSLILETRKVGETAEQALLKAEAVGMESRKVLEEFEKHAVSLREDTKKLVVQMEQERSVSEAQFKKALIQQQDDAYRRELLLILILGVLILAILVALFIARKRTPGAPARKAFERKLDVGEPGETIIHKPQLAEYVLDGRDENGIRYLLRISGDQLVKADGIVIGRNPSDSPYIINHADVSRKHARMKVMKNRVFIEDLGSTNGTSINGQSIDDKGPVSVDNGDQIIIGSVVMKLRVLGA